MEARSHRSEGIDYLVVEPDGFDPDRVYPVVYLLHGYGSNMGDLAGLSPSIGKDEYLFVCPNAPIRMELAPGATGFAWWDPSSPDSDRALQVLSAVVDRVDEQYRVLPGRSVLGGFSQGAMLTYEFGLPRPDVFGGLVGLSGQINNADRVRSSLPEDRGQSIFIAHGTEDTMIPVDRGRDSRDFLKAEGYEPDYQEYPMGHQVSQEVLDDLVPWIKEVAVSSAQQRQRTTQ